MRIFLSLLTILILGTSSLSLAIKVHTPINNINSKFPNQQKSLLQLQQEFLDLRFGMFIHFNIPTFGGHDWPDPNLSCQVFNPTKLDCNQWADAAVAAGMTYACLTTKHHSGFCIWPTKTTGYNVMNSPCKRDVVKEYVNAFRKRGLKIFLYYSILDTHHFIRPRWITREHVTMIKKQLTELLTNYGEIGCLVIDGWDAHWSRISYEEIPFKEIYNHVKSLQPNCLISEHNAGKYPGSELFYTDVKHYEQNAGQIISRETNQLPAQAGIPINKNWFWKENFPKEVVKNAGFIVNENLIPLNEAHCNFILNVAPNTDGLIDQNVVEELGKIGQLWRHPGKVLPLKVAKQPIIESNLAKLKRMDSGWSFDLWTADFASDDDFKTCWIPSTQTNTNYLTVIFNEETEINTIGFVESTNPSKFPVPLKTRILSYSLQYWAGNKWNDIKIETQKQLLRMHHFGSVRTRKIRLNLENFEAGAGIAELLVYNEK
jgi:alpha-L-fucosidase